MENNRSDAPTLVFEAGGTTTRAALYHPRTDTIGPVIRRRTPSFHHVGLPPGPRLRGLFYDSLEELRRELLSSALPSRVAVAFPGPVTTSSDVLAAPTLWGEDPALPPGEVIQALRRQWPGADVHLLNDVTAAGYYYVSGTGGDLCVVAVGTGIGQKVFLGGRPALGTGGRGGEIGHWRVDWSPDAPVCHCGGRGHLNPLASGTATRYLVERAARADPEAFEASALHALTGGDPAHFTNDAFVRAAAERDSFTWAIAERMAQWLGRAVAAIHLAVGVERFVITGGLALALGEPYRVALCEAASEGAWPNGLDWNAAVELGTGGDLAGLVGAGRYARASSDAPLSRYR